MSVLFISGSPTPSTQVTRSTQVHPGVFILRLHLSGGDSLLPAPGYHKEPVPTSELSALTILTVTADFPPKRLPNQHDLFKKKSG